MSRFLPSLGRSQRSFVSTAIRHSAATTWRRRPSPGLSAIQQRFACTEGQQGQPKSLCHKPQEAPIVAPSAFRAHFWTSTHTWGRAAVNTFRCLVGCTIGDFSGMWFLQMYYPEIGIGAIMTISMGSGLTTSVLLETALLRYGRDRLGWMAAVKTAVGMSMISMLTMEMAQNLVDYHLTGGAVQFDSPQFWLAAIISMGAGFLTPLPYNYLRLRKYGKACH